MKKVVSEILVAAGLCVPVPSSGTAWQTQQVPAAVPSAEMKQESGAPRIAPGSVIPVQLTSTIDARKAKTGDEVEAKVTQDLKSGSGELLVPKDTRVVGHVTEAQARSKEQKRSQIGIAFDHAVMKNGGGMPLPVSIQAIVAPPFVDNGNDNNTGGESAGQPASAPGAGGMLGSPHAPGAGMGAGNSPQAPSPSTAGEERPTSAPARQPITANTQGVVGISNLTLSASANQAQGSVVSSEKNNVKLERGTWVLLRVNQ